MAKKREDELWDSICLLLESEGNEEKVIELSKQLSEAGDWRGSETLGWALAERGDKLSNLSISERRALQVAAAEAYILALQQNANYCSDTHAGLANFYYYGRGGYRDYAAAFKYLTSYFEIEDRRQKPDIERIRHTARKTIMLGELYFQGLGTSKNLEKAKELFSSAADVGYVAGIWGLLRVATVEKKYFRVARYYLRIMKLTISLLLEDREHPLLSGMGKRRGVYWIAKAPNPQILD